MELPKGVEIVGAIHERYDQVLSPEACEFLAGLQREFGARRLALLAERGRRQALLDAGGTLDFLPDTAHIRADETWRVAEPSPGLVDRRVEITGPTDRKMTVNALNSGAKVWLADFEDASAPLWENQVGGQLNLIDALDRRIDFAAGGKEYALGDDAGLATIVVRPRGWHLDEKHFLVDGERVAAALFDFGLYFFHCAQRQLDRGQGPYFYLPKLESHAEAKLWADVFARAEEQLGIAHGTIRATVLIETVTAAFEMEEILYELREYSAGLNAGRWDYLFSIVKKFRARGGEYLLPERNAVTMTAPFMRAYTNLLVATCHRRGAHAIGGMAAFIPSRRDPEVNATALDKVRQDKRREAGDGFDGSWVAHPDLVPICREEFGAVLGERPNQRDKPVVDPGVTAADLLAVNSGTDGVQITEAGLRNNVSVGLRYLASWMGGVGAAAIFNLMEDAATAEICRSQIWQWIHNDVVLDDGVKVTRGLVNRIIAEELEAIRSSGDAPAARLQEAASLFRRVSLDDDYAEFLTLPAYEQLSLSRRRERRTTWT
ncbi:MAG: malate synthase A [Stackebrandtia sp.]